MSLSFAEADKLMANHILEKVYQYGVTRETAEKVVLWSWPGTDRASAERLAKAADKSDEILTAFWRATLFAPFLASQYIQGPTLCIALAYLAFRSWIIDRVKLRTYHDVHAQLLLQWGVTVATRERDSSIFCI